MKCGTALHKLSVGYIGFLQHAIFELDIISSFLSVLMYFASIVVQVIGVCPFYLNNFFIYIKGTFTTDLYQLVLTWAWRSVIFQFLGLFSTYFVPLHSNLFKDFY